MTDKSRVDALSRDDFAEKYHIRQRKSFTDLRYGSINILSDQDDDG